MMRARGLPAILLAAALAGCAFVPQDNHRLDEAQRVHGLAMGDPRIARVAGADLARAGELLQQASVAQATLDDSAVVDHLAYLATQHVAIAREAANLEAASAR